MTSDDPNRSHGDTPSHSDTSSHGDTPSNGDTPSGGDTPSHGADLVPGEGAGTGGGPDAAQPPPRRPKGLSSEAQRRLQAARLWIAANRPYYAKAVFSCAVIPTAAPAGVGIDEWWRIYANSEYLETLTVERARSGADTCAQPWAARPRAKSPQHRR